MFCPKCDALLVRHNGELKCLSGNMPLSRNLERVLTERYGSHLPSEQVEESSREKSDWYCPGCGVSLDVNLVCPGCRLSLKDLRRTLVELHPHS